MEIIKHDDLGSSGGYFVRMTKKEALATIVSLSLQIKGNDPNTHREEMYSKEGEYFTISVTPDERAEE